MSDFLEVIREARRQGDPALLCRAIPYAAFLGLTAELREGRCVSVLTYDDALIGNPLLPALHGGTIGALLESAAIFQVCWDIDLAVTPKTITFTVDYLRSGRPVDTYARATIARQGRRVAAVQVEAWQEDPSRPIAVALGHLRIQPA
ncbi:MAG: PaaI family thioesterase [Nannocystaceae bacterium]